MSANKAKMKIEIASEAKNSFLGRKEITFPAYIWHYTTG